jgi:hypothetical protein
MVPLIPLSLTTHDHWQQGWITHPLNADPQSS